MQISGRLFEPADLICPSVGYDGRVSDEPFFAPNHKPKPVVRPKPPNEPVWTLSKGTKSVECEIRYHGEAYGFECVCLFNGELVYGRRFALKAGARKEAEVQRQRLISEGWRAIDGG
jgi:hypothetical protein